MAKPGPGRHALMVYIDQALYERIRRIAFERRTTLTAITEEALAAWVTAADTATKGGPPHA